MTVATLTAPAGATALPLRTDPWAHQIEAFDFARAKRGAMLAIGMGGGKSAVAIALVEDDLRDLDHPARVLIVCPKSVVGVWPDQLHTHAPSSWETWAGEVQGARGQLRRPSVARRAVALVDATKRATILDRPLAAIVNVEASWQGDLGKLIDGTPWDAVVIDESHRIKAPGGRASRFLARVCEKARQRGGRVLALTGTPMPHSPLDLYGQFRSLNPTVLGTSFARFRAHYGAPKVLYTKGDGEPVYATAKGGQLIYDGVREDRLGELTDRAGRLMYQLGQEDLDRMLGLQDPSDVFRTCDLEPNTRRVYDELERDLIAKVGEGVVTAANAMVLVLRLAQATSGFAVDFDTHTARQLADPPEKAQLLADVLEDLDLREPVVVFCRFHHDLDQVQAVAERQGRRYGELSGRRRDGLTDKGTMNPDIDVLGAQLKSGGVGIDLTRARYAVYYSLDFNLGDAEQSRKRVHRPGQDRHVTYIHLLAENTVDRAVYGALRRRQNVINAVLDRLKKTDNQGATP